MQAATDAAMNKEAFNEEFVSDKADPLASREDAAAVRAWQAFDDAPAPPEQPIYTRTDYRDDFAELVRLFFEFCCYGETPVKKALTETRLPVIARRLIALAWTVNPGLITHGEGNAPSLTKLGELLGCTGERMSQIAAEAT